MKTEDEDIEIVCCVQTFFTVSAFVGTFGIVVGTFDTVFGVFVTCVYANYYRSCAANYYLERFYVFCRQGGGKDSNTFGFDVKHWYFPPLIEVGITVSCGAALRKS